MHTVSHTSVILTVAVLLLSAYQTSQTTQISILIIALSNMHVIMFIGAYGLNMGEQNDSRTQVSQVTAWTTTNGCC